VQYSITGVTQPFVFPISGAIVCIFPFCFFSKVQSAHSLPPLILFHADAPKHRQFCIGTYDHACEDRQLWEELCTINTPAQLLYYSYGCCIYAYTPTPLKKHTLACSFCCKSSFNTVIVFRRSLWTRKKAADAEQLRKGEALLGEPSSDVTKPTSTTTPTAAPNPPNAPRWTKPVAPSNNHTPTTPQPKTATWQLARWKATKSAGDGISCDSSGTGTAERTLGSCKRAQRPHLRKYFRGEARERRRRCCATQDRFVYPLDFTDTKL